MKLAARFCRSCGSKILVRDICHNCTSNPVAGNNYCYDCGALTPLGDKCEQCGANFKKRSPLGKLVVISGVIVIIGIAAALMIITNNHKKKSPYHNTSKLSKTEIVDTVPTPVTSSTTSSSDTAKKADTAKVEVPKTDPVKKDTAKSIIQEVNVFSQQELSVHKISCSYFRKTQRGSVFFFTANGLGYLKINGNIIPLKRIKKGTDVSFYSGEKYQAQLTIDGLSGNEKAWLAAVSLVVKDSAHKLISKQKVYSSCIEF